MSEIRLNTLPLEINLLQFEEAANESRGKLRPLALLLLLAAGAGALGYVWSNVSSEKDRISTELAAVNTRITALQAQQEAAAQTGGMAPISLLLSFPEAMAQARPETTAMLDRIAKLLPKEANIVSLVYDATGKLQISGQFARMESIIAFLQQLKASSDFRAVNLLSVNNKTEKEAADSGGEGLIADVPEGEQPPVDPPEGTAAPPSANAPSKLPMLEATFELEYVPAPDSSDAGQGGAK